MFFFVFFFEINQDRGPRYLVRYFSLLSAVGCLVIDRGSYVKQRQSGENVQRILLIYGCNYPRLTIRTRLCNVIWRCEPNNTMTCQSRCNCDETELTARLKRSSHLGLCRTRAQRLISAAKSKR